MNIRSLRVVCSVVLLAAAAALRAGACPVCYGAPGSPSTQAMTAAVFSLLGVTGGVLATFAAVFLRFQKRARALLVQAEKEAESHG